MFGQSNRMWNVKNPHQGDFPKVLCVCSAGLLRSPTLAWVLSNEPFNANTRACGVSSGFALIIADEVLLEWADIIICVNEETREELFQKFPDLQISRKLTDALDIPDRYAYRDPELVEIIKQQLKDKGY